MRKEAKELRHNLLEHIGAGKRGRYYTNTWGQSADEHLWGCEEHIENHSSEHEHVIGRAWEGDKKLV